LSNQGETIILHIRSSVKTHDKIRFEVWGVAIGNTAGPNMSGPYTRSGRCRLCGVLTPNVTLSWGVTKSESTPAAEATG
jgi:hypothetical protein